MSKVPVFFPETRNTEFIGKKTLELAAKSMLSRGTLGFCLRYIFSCGGFPPFPRSSRDKRGLISRTAASNEA